MENNIPTHTQAERLASLLISERKERLARKIKNYPRRNPVASDIGECDRQIVYGVTDWDKRSPFNEELIARFEVGNQRENEIIKELMDLGYKIVENQVSFEVKDKLGRILATGRIDGKIEFEGRRIPFEIKSLNPNTWINIKNYQDFNKKAWLKKYIRQMQVYLYANNEEQGLFLLDDCLGHWKPVVISLDYEATEVILKRFEAILGHIENKTYPDRIEYTSTVCGSCSFNHICLPTQVISDSTEFIVDKDIEDKLKRREELGRVIEEYTVLDNDIKEIFKGKQKVTIGNPPSYIITSKERTRGSYDFKLLPEETLKTIYKQSTYYVTNIEGVKLSNA